jgi:heterodisulfide reductase subunit B2
MIEAGTGDKKYLYYPGCSLKGSASEYDLSTRVVFEKLGVELRELEGWNCCGASSAHNVSHDLAVALPFRNLAIAETEGLDLVAPCASCYNRLKVAETSVLGSPEVKERMEDIVEKKFTGSITTLNTLELLVGRVGLGRVRAIVSRKLEGLKVVSYYGCLMSRPPKKLGVKNPDDPTELDELMESLGAEPKFWAYKTDCCGAGHAMPRADIVKTLVGKLHEMALEAGAEAIVTACPMCHANIDMRQADEPSGRLPVFFFTELMALAMGIGESRHWLEKHIVSPIPLLERLNLL